MSIVRRASIVLLALLIVSTIFGNGSLSRGAGSEQQELTPKGYPIVDTGQLACYDDDDELFDCPAPGASFYGQDSQFDGPQPSYTDNGDGTVTDNITGLMWQQSPDTDGDGDIDAADKLTYDQAVAGASTCSHAAIPTGACPPSRSFTH